MCWWSLENIGIHLGENCPRLWLVIGQYKTGAKILTFLVVILQLIRISFVAYEWKFINTEYPQSETIAFCFLSILLGVVSLGLESLLLYAIQKNNIKKIQPWFMCTFLIFLIASLAFVITSTLYIIRPIDHNVHLDVLKSKSQPVNQNGTDVNRTSGSRPSIVSSLPLDSYDEYMMEEGISSSSTSTESTINAEIGIDDCALNNSTCTRAIDGGSDKNVTKWTKHRRFINSNSNKTNEIEGDEKMEGNAIMPVPSVSREYRESDRSSSNNNSDLSSGENVSFRSSPGGVCTSTNKNKIFVPIPDTKAKKGRKSIQYIMKAHNGTYAVHPIVPFSYLLDVLRCIPQLFLVNRFVKAEQLHEHLIHPSHSHTSLSALYVKPLPVLV